MSQLLLFRDPRPLVDRLGVRFFHELPDRAGVYLMRDEAGTVVYVGKAKSLRRRLASYRVANPERLGRRHLRLLSSVARIDYEECADEAAALAREAEYLLALRPRFNRAGVWVGPRRHLAWRRHEASFELSVLDQVGEGWVAGGPMGAGVWYLRSVVARLLWCALQPGRGLDAIPAGWFGPRRTEPAVIPVDAADIPALAAAEAGLHGVVAGRAEPLAGWVRERAAGRSHPFEVAAREADLEYLLESCSS